MKTIELTTEVRVAGARGRTRVWVPSAQGLTTDWQRPAGGTFEALGGAAERVDVPEEGLSIVVADFPAGVEPVVRVVDRVDVGEHAVDLAGVGAGPAEVPAELGSFLAATRLLPTGGIVGETAARIVAGASGDVAKARAIYDWIFTHTTRDPTTRGCGIGDIASMLTTGALCGKCADLNALFVGLARAAGLPARELFGVRVGPSAHGYRSLGVASSVVSKAQHCRAEVWIGGAGWVPVDPADVRKVVLEEVPGGLSLDDERVVAARERLFGSWEMNWLAYNHAHDVVLPGASGGPLPFFMYPHAESEAGRADPYDPDTFTYRITVA